MTLLAVVGGSGSNCFSFYLTHPENSLHDG